MKKIILFLALCPLIYSLSISARCNDYELRRNQVARYHYLISLAQVDLHSLQTDISEAQKHLSQVNKDLRNGTLDSFTKRELNNSYDIYTRELSELQQELSSLLAKMAAYNAEFHQAQEALKQCVE